MLLELTLNGTNIVVESDDNTAINVLIKDSQTENAYALNYVPMDMFDMIDCVKSSMRARGHYLPMQNDRVRHEEYGIGTVICKALNEPYYGVAFDEPNYIMHKCQGDALEWGKSGTRNNCWWVKPSEIEPIGPLKPQDQDAFLVRFQSYLASKEREMFK